MADQNKRRPVPTGGDVLPAALDRAQETPSHQEGNASDGDGDGEGDEDDRELVEARVLLAHGELRPDDVFVGSVEEVEQLLVAGVVDAHPDAVAYAKGLQG